MHTAEGVGTGSALLPLLLPAAAAVAARQAGHGSMPAPLPISSLHLVIAICTA